MGSALTAGAKIQMPLRPTRMEKLSERQKIFIVPAPHHDLNGRDANMLPRAAGVKRG